MKQLGRGDAREAASLPGGARTRPAGATAALVETHEARDVCVQARAHQAVGERGGQEGGRKGINKLERIYDSTVFFVGSPHTERQN